MAGSGLSGVKGGDTCKLLRLSHTLMLLQKPRNAYFIWRVLGFEQYQAHGLGPIRCSRTLASNGVSHLRQFLIISLSRCSNTERATQELLLRSITLFTRISMRLYDRTPADSILLFPFLAIRTRGTGGKPSNFIAVPRRAIRFYRICCEITLSFVPWR